MASKKKRSTLVCVSRKKAVELGLRKAPVGKPNKPAAGSLFKTNEGKKYAATLKELAKYRKVKASKQTCSDMSTLASQAVRAGNAFLSAHGGEMTRKSAAVIRKKVKAIESSRNKFCKRVAKRISKADKAAKRAASLRGRR